MSSTGKSNSRNNKNAIEISLDEVCILHKVTGIEQDDIGNEKNIYSLRDVFCSELPVWSSEFYKASQQDIKVAYILAVDVEEYEGETLVSYMNDIYAIYKTFKRKDGLLELYCCERVGVDYADRS